MGKISQREIEVTIKPDFKISAVATEDEDYPRIDLYFDDGLECLIVGSLEYSTNFGLRLISYSDLSRDEPESIHTVK